MESLFDGLEENFDLLLVCCGSEFFGVDLVWCVVAGDDEESVSELDV